MVMLRMSGMMMKDRVVMLMTAAAAAAERSFTRITPFLPIPHLYYHHQLQLQLQLIAHHLRDHHHLSHQEEEVLQVLEVLGVDGVVELPLG